ncbi:PA2779 family protein [Amphritea sp. HPY]|uniref:PA2779 family protein n=1 Tax=Amphritea sp. HPY TaxID=3421652 RepID=UPI003D7C89CB
MMSHEYLRRSLIVRLLIALVLSFSFQSSVVNAAIVPTETVIQMEQQQYTKQQLLQSLESAELQQQLLTMGVDPDVLEERIASLTDAEISQLNAQLETQPAGEGFFGLIALFFVVFIITDALCATDLFSFVNCINR